MLESLPEWLFEGQLLVYGVLGAALACLVIVWKQTPRKPYLAGIVGLVALIGVYFLLDVLVQTDREQISKAIKDISAGVEQRSVARVFENVSDSYNRHGSTKATFQQTVSGIIGGRHVDRVAMWDYEFAPGYKQLGRLKLIDPLHTERLKARFGDDYATSAEGG